MTKDPSSRRRAAEFDSLDPATGGTCKIRISSHRMQAVATRSMGQAKECALIVPMILKSPTAVFEGLRRDDDDDKYGVGWRCYCGLPKNAYRTDGSPREAYENQVYLVFVNEDGVAYNWRWENADQVDQQLPENYTIRFREQLYPQHITL